MACQKKEIRKNIEFCSIHDEPFKFWCETDSTYICVECIPEHTGHHFVKQDQNFFMAKKKLSSEINRLDRDREILEKYEANYTYVKQQLLLSYRQSTQELDKIFNTIKNRLVDEHHRSKEELTKFLEKEIQELEEQEKELVEDMEVNRKERSRIV